MKKLFLFCAVVLLFAATSCHKSVGQEDVATTTETGQKALPVKFKINGKEVLESDFFKQLLPDQTTLRDNTSQMTAIADKYKVLCEFGRTDADGNEYDIINVFLDNEAYYEYADANGHTKERQADLVIQDLADYAVSSGAIAECEATGSVPKYYTDYMDAKLVAVGFKPSTQSEVKLRSLFTLVYKGCDGSEGVSSSFPVFSHPWLGLIGYNNDISSLVPFGGGSTNIVFDKWFFSKRITSIWAWKPFRTTTFCSGQFIFVNDRATSWISF